MEGLADAVVSSDKNKVLVVLHTSTSHGPSYNKHYPEEFEVFTPVCTTVEMSKADPAELMNSYDNSILYTDYLIHSAISAAASLPREWKRCVIYVSDDGESLGEGNMYMQGVPLSIAPKEQYEIPFIVWAPERHDSLKDIPLASQYQVFHTVLDFLGVESEVYDAQMSVFQSVG